MTHLRINRRTLLTGTVALGTVGLLAACGGGSDKKISGKAASSTEEIVKNLEINKQDRSSLKQGGEFRGSVSAVGPNFNILTQSGYTTENLTAFGGACNIPSAIGFTSLSPAGEYSLNDDYVSDYKAETVGGVQTITFKLNSKAVFNDGTPVDVEAIRAAWTVYRNPDDGYNVIAAPFWQQVASIDPVDGDKTRVKIVMSKPLYPAETLGLLGLHPALTDKELFNNGFVNKPMDQYWSGPFKIGEWNSSAKTLTLVPNDKWWGEKPLLDRIIWREMGDEAERAAFKNGELDSIGFAGLATYNAVKDQPGVQIRSGQSVGVINLQFNPTRVTDTALRRAVFAAVNRSQLAKVKFGQINWDEPLTGSLIAMPFQKGYQDAMPTNPGAEAAAKILEAAGYSKNGDYYAKDGKTAGFSITYFGSDATSLAQFQNLEQQLKAAGIKLEQDNQPQSQFNSVMGSKQYDCAFSGWGIGADPADSVQYFYTSEINEGVGDPELDKYIASIYEKESHEEQLKMAAEAEKQHMEKVAIYFPYANGPSYVAVKEKLANYGPSLFATSYTDPKRWVNVGWQN